MAKPVHEKKLGADYEQLLRVVFSCFRGIASASKSCIINLPDYQEFAKFLRSLEQFFQAVNGQNNF